MTMMTKFSVQPRQVAGVMGFVFTILGQMRIVFYENHRCSLGAAEP